MYFLLFTESSPIQTRWMRNGTMLSDNDTQNKKYIRNEDLSQTSPIAIENPNPPCPIKI